LIALIINAHPDDRRQMADDRNLICPPSSVLRHQTSVDEKDQLASGSTRRRAVKRADVGVRIVDSLRRDDARIDPLFTMSDNTPPPRRSADERKRIR
jgi:hypothetical protein